MRLEHPKEKIDIVGRLRNFEPAFVLLLIRKSNPQGEFFCDEIDPAQPQRELLQKAAEHEKEWLSCLISFSNSKLSSNDSGGRMSLSGRSDSPFARSHIRIA